VPWTPSSEEAGGSDCLLDVVVPGASVWVPLGISI